MDNAVSVDQGRHGGEGAWRHHKHSCPGHVHPSRNEVLAVGQAIVVEVHLHAPGPVAVEVRRIPVALHGRGWSICCAAPDVDVGVGQLLPDPVGHPEEVLVREGPAREVAAARHVAAPHVHGHAQPAGREAQGPDFERSAPGSLECGCEEGRGGRPPVVPEIAPRAVDVLTVCKPPPGLLQRLRGVKRPAEVEAEGHEELPCGARTEEAVQHEPEVLPMICHMPPVVILLGHGPTKIHAILPCNGHALQDGLQPVARPIKVLRHKKARRGWAMENTDLQVARVEESRLLVGPDNGRPPERDRCRERRAKPSRHRCCGRGRVVRREYSSGLGDAELQLSAVRGSLFVRTLHPVREGGPVGAS
mmetsp:Transcript_76348/g.216100  ORF Transcript_76348/g.216100 Transcript_76348/m.216100 type:complete len:361 (+) Transcript_76348:427-1509(+)